MICDGGRCHGGAVNRSRRNRRKAEPMGTVSRTVMVCQLPLVEEVATVVAAFDQVVPDKSGADSGMQLTPTGVG